MAGGSGTIELLAHFRFRGRTARLPQPGEKRPPPPPSKVRQIVAPTSYFAVAAPGLEPFVEAELRQLKVANLRAVEGGVEFSGPVLQGVRFEGDKAVLTFGHVGGGLEAKGGELTGFTVAGEDRKFHPAKAEIKGETVVCFAVLRPGFAPSEPLRAELLEEVVRSMGKAIRPERVLFARELPKTRSAKIMRRVVRATYLGRDPGDLSSLDNPGGVKAIADAQ